MAKRKRNKALLPFTRPIEAAVARLAIGIVGRLPLDRASDLGGRLGRLIGPRLAVDRLARTNLRIAFPEKSAAEIEAILLEMWDNLGRTLFEYPHIAEIIDPASGRVEVEGEERLRALAEKGGPAVMFSGHFANWEVLSTAASRRGVDLQIVVREPNNPLVRPLVERFRGISGTKLVPKGTAGVKLSIAHLNQGGVVGVLSDQKLNRGLEVSFFGQPAMTAAGAAQLALRFRCPLMPTWLERLEGARFRLVIDAPLELPPEGGRPDAILAVTQQVTAHLERRIRARPGQWFWVHRRWSESVYESAAGNESV